MTITRELSSQSPGGNSIIQDRLGELRHQLYSEHFDAKRSTSTSQTDPTCHSDTASYYNSRGFKLYERYIRHRDICDLQVAIQLVQQAVNMPPRTGSHRAMQLCHLGDLLYCRYSSTSSKADHNASKAAFQEALSTQDLSIIFRVAAGAAAMHLCWEDSDWQAAIQAANNTMALIPQSMARSQCLQDKHFSLGKLGGLASDATAIALQAGLGAFDAMNLLEQGRGVLLASLEEEKADLSELWFLYPDMANSMSRLRESLAVPEPTSQAAPEDIQEFYRVRKQECDQYDRLLGDIRALPLFEDFGRVQGKLEDVEVTEDGIMRGILARGSIAIINISDYQCDAILINRRRAFSIALTNLSKTEIESRMRKNRFESSDILEWLWDTIARPILDALGLTKKPQGGKWPRIWWIATGPLSRFPLHAAGYHHQGLFETVLDRAISSYISSVKVLLRGRLEPFSPSPETAGPVLVGIEHTSGHARLPFAATEVKVLNALLASMSLGPTQPEPRKRELMAYLQRSDVFHFAGHCCNDPRNPLESHLLLGDGEQLKVSDLLSLDLRQKSPFLAYLSACGTYQIVNDEYSDESLHLLSCFNIAGFRNAIGTLWSVQDESCLDMARLTYESIYSGDMLDDDLVCRGLHEACREVRRKCLDSLQNTVARHPSAKEENIVSGNRADGRAWTQCTGGCDSEVKARDILSLDDDDFSRQHSGWIPFVHFGM